MQRGQSEVKMKTYHMMITELYSTKLLFHSIGISLINVSFHVELAISVYVFVYVNENSIKIFICDLNIRFDSYISLKSQCQ